VEKALPEEFTYCHIIDCLREMNFKVEHHEGYSPVYTRNKLTNALYQAFGFRTDYQILAKRAAKNIFKMTKKQ